MNYENQEEFKPFVPQYAMASSNQVAVRYPPPKSYQSFKPNIYTGPVTSATAHSFDFAKIRGQMHHTNHLKPVAAEFNYNRFPINNLESAFSNIVSKTVTPEKKVRDNVRSHTEVVTSSYKSLGSPNSKLSDEKDKTKSDFDEIKSKVEGEDQKPKDSKEEFTEEFDTENGKDEKPESDEFKEGEAKEGETEEGGPKNHTVSYEYHSDEVDEDLLPPPSFYNSKNKYEDIYNPFEDPHFDFDQFLEKLGSTTTSSTTTTTTTTTTTPKPIPQVYEVHESKPVKALNHQQSAYANEDPIYHDESPIYPPSPPKLLSPVGPPLYNQPSLSLHHSVPTVREPVTQPSIEKEKESEQDEEYVEEEEDEEEVIKPATPAPKLPTKPVSEDLVEDYDVERGASNKKIYSSKIHVASPKTVVSAPTTTEVPEYEYYYEEYDEPESNATSADLLKTPSQNQSEPVKYSAKYKDGPKSEDLQEKNSKLNIKIQSAPTDSSPKKGQYLIETTVSSTTPKPKKILATAKPIPTPFSSTTERFDKKFASGQFLIETSVITTTTPKTKKTVSPARSRTTTVRPRTTEKPHNSTQKPTTTTTTDLYELDSRQVQSVIVPR